MSKRVGTDDGERKVIADIEKYGWHSLNITAEKDSPPFTFTIGLFETWQHPELIVVGLKPETVRPILATLTQELAAKQPRDLTAVADDLIEGAGCFVEVARRHYREYVGYARWYYNGNHFPLYQLVWPDQDGRFPWNPRAPEAYRRAQPVLGEASGSI